ncbi:MAG: HAD family hydrolase [Anaerolineales bacterium]|nr:HAD family hydrolase [Anaerolineales bacterium]
MTLIVFDFDGVLADTIDDMLSIAGRVAADLGHPCQPSPADLDALERMEFSQFGRQLGIPEDKIEAFVSSSLQLFASLPTPPKIFPGMRQVVQELAHANRVAIVTGNTARILRRFLEHHGLESSVELALTADDPGNRPEKLALILSTLSQPGAPCYLVGDAVSDVRAAKKTGLTSVAVAWGHQSESHLRSANPSYLARTPEELLKILMGSSI